LTESKIKVRKIKITGNTVISTEELVHIVDPVEGKELDLAELQQVADAITAAFRARGYGFTRAYVPAQEVKDGLVEIAVLESRVGEIVVNGNKNYSTEFIKKGFAPLVRDGAVKQSSLEKSLLVLNDYPDLKATATLEAGKQPGTPDIVVAVEDQLPLHLVADYDNFGTKSVSKNRFGLEVTLSRFLIIEGSSLSLRGVIGTDPKSYHYGRAAYLAPINSYGTKLGVSGYGGDFDVGEKLAELNISSTTWGYSIYLAHPWIRTRFVNLSAEFGFESKDATQFLLGSVATRDKLRMLRAGLNSDWIDSTGQNFISLTVFQGLEEALGAMQNNDPQSSRLGADNRFTKLHLNLARVQRINEYFSVILRGSGQASTNSLVATEQFFIGGADSVRGYPQGEFLGDDGYNVSTEARITPFPDKGIGQLVFFVDHGGASIKDPPPGVKKYNHLTGAGFGLRLDIPSYHFNSRFDVGFPVQPAKASSGGRPTFYIQTVVRF